METESNLSSSERICAECGRKFAIWNMELWAYKLHSKGRTIWFCRYNCVRAGERKLKDAGRQKTMKANKPTKDVLEADLKSGLDLKSIAKKYDCTTATINNWIKGYRLIGLKGLKDQKADPPVGEVQNHPPVDMVRASPTLIQIEQRHTDGPVQESPKVEIEPDLYRCADCGEAFFSIVEHSTLCKVCHETLVNDRANEEMITEPQGMTEEENMSDAEWEAANPVPEPTLGELWENVEASLIPVHKKYVEQADNDFRAQLFQLVLAVTNGRGLSV